MNDELRPVVYEEYIFWPVHYVFFFFLGKVDSYFMVFYPVRMLPSIQNVYDLVIVVYAASSRLIDC